MIDSYKKLLDDSKKLQEKLEEVEAFLGNGTREGQVIVYDFNYETEEYQELKYRYGNVEENVISAVGEMQELLRFLERVTK